MRSVLSTVLTLTLPVALTAQTPAQDSAATVDPATGAKVVEGVVRRIEEGYIFPDKAKEMAVAVRGRARKGEYDRIGGALALADRLTQDLQAVSRDLHLRVFYDGRGVRDEVPDAEPTPAERREQAKLGRRVNWGFERAERLDGNVGYLEIRSFNFEPDAVDSTLAAAMNFLARTDALIVDVRRNGGGDPNMVALVCSYLMPPNTLVNKFYWRPQNRWDEFRTKAVTGRHYGTTRPVYVLTSDGTFSGAEEFAYDVQTQKRGEIVGDTTGGGAHPGGFRKVTEHFGVWVPSGRAVNPVTGKNWEGTGVIPDVPTASDDALRIAHLRALGRLLAGERDEERRTQLHQALEQVERRPART
jgi:retinol-binding protein 3